MRHVRFGKPRANWGRQVAAATLGIGLVAGVASVASPPASADPVVFAAAEHALPAGAGVPVQSNTPCGAPSGAASWLANVALFEGGTNVGYQDFPVAADGSWSGEFRVPFDASPGPAQLKASCFDAAGHISTEVTYDSIDFTVLATKSTFTAASATTSAQSPLAVHSASPCAEPMPGHGWIAIVELVESDGSSPPSYTTWQYQDYPVDSSGNWGGTFDLGVHVQPGPAYLVATCYYSLGPDPSVDEVHYQPIAFTVQPASPRVSAKTVAFGPARIGTTTPARTVTVTNVGGAPLSITSTTITGTNARDFVIVQDGCSGVAVLSGTSCSTRVAFRPSAHGNRTATLRYGFYPATSSVAVALTGRGCLALLGSLCI